MHGFIVPPLERSDVYIGTLTDRKLNVLRYHGLTGLVDDQVHVGIGTDCYVDVLRSRVHGVAFDRDLEWFFNLEIVIDSNDGGFAKRCPGGSRSTVVRHHEGAEPAVVPADSFDGDTFMFGDIDLRSSTGQ